MKAWKLLGAAAALAIVAASGANAAEPIKIGVVLPYSGVNADLGNQIDKAFDLYVKLHAKDILPYSVKLIKRDEGPPTGATGKTDTTELITQDHVKVLTGYVFSPSAIASAPIVTQAKVPMIIANAGTAWITNLSPYIVRTSFSMWDPAYPMGVYAATKLGCKTAAIGYTDFPPGKDSSEAFKTGFEKSGGKVIDQIPMGNPAQVPDFTPFLQRVKDEHPNCFYVFIPSGAHAAGVVKAYGEVGLRQAGIKLIGPMDVIPDNKLQDMNKSIVGTIVMSSYAAEYKTPVNESFVKEWHAAYGAKSMPDFMSADGWDTMAAIFAAIKKLHGDLDDGAKVVDALKGWKHDGPRGEIEIDPATRDIIQTERAEEVVGLPDGKYGIKVLATYPRVKDECKVLKLGRCGQ